jgi:hypothetical protein
MMTLLMSADRFFRSRIEPRELGYLERNVVAQPNMRVSAALELREIVEPHQKIEVVGDRPTSPRLSDKADEGEEVGDEIANCLNKFGHGDHRWSCDAECQRQAFCTETPASIEVGRSCIPVVERP